MKTPQSASKPQKGGSALNTPTSGKITKNKSTPMSLKAKVLEKNAKLALLKAQDTVTLNGKSPLNGKPPKTPKTPKTPKNVGTPKKGGSPQNTGSPKKGGSPQNAGSPKNAGTPKTAPKQNQTPKPKQSPAANQNGTAGKKRKSIEGTPALLGNASGKKPKKTPEASPEVKLGLKIEKLLESPKGKNAVDSPQTAGKMSKSQKMKAKKLAQSAGEGVVPKSDGLTNPAGSETPTGMGKKAMKNRKQAAGKLAQAAAQVPKSVGQTKPDGSPSPGKKAKKQRQKEARKLAQSAGETVPKSVGQTKAVGSPSPGSPGKKGKKQKKNEAKKLAQSAGETVPTSNGQAKPVGPPSPGQKTKKQRQKEAKAKKNQMPVKQGGAAPVADKKAKLQKKIEAKILDKHAQKQPKQKGDPSSKSQKSEKLKVKRQKRNERRQSKGLNESRDNLLKEVEANSGALGDFPNPTNVENAIKALIEEEKERKAEKPDLLDEPAPVLVNVEFFYHPPARGIQRITLPNSYLRSNPDVTFIAVDMKKARNDPEESIEHHANKFKSSGVTSISEILPLRSIHKEHSQYEEKRKLANRADVILIDSKIAHRVSSLIPRKFLHKKTPIPVRTYLDGAELKTEIATALRKTPVTLKKNSLETSIKIGHVGMKVKALVENLTAVAAALSDEKFYPGGTQNIRRLNVKSFKSDSYPVFISLANRNQIPQPKAPLKRKRETVEGEVTTAGVTVAVHPSGEVKITSKDEDADSDFDLDETEHDTSPKKKKKGASKEDSEDEDYDSDGYSEVDPADVDAFLAANKDSDEDNYSSDGVSDEIEKAEQEFLLELRKQQDALEATAQKGPAGDDEDESDLDEEDDDSDEEEDDSDDEEEDGDSDDDDIPNLVPAKVAPPKKGKGGKPGQNGLQAKGKAGVAQKGRPARGQKGKPNTPQKGKPNTPQKGKPNSAQKGKPTSAQKRGSFQKTQNSPKAKRR